MSAARKYSATPLYEAEVLFDYDAVEPTELTVQKGQVNLTSDATFRCWFVAPLSCLQVRGHEATVVSVCRIGHRADSVYVSLCCRL